VASETKEVANIDYVDGEANLNDTNATKTVQKGEVYWTIEATSSEAFADAFGMKDRSDYETEYTQLFVLNEDLNRLTKEREQMEERYAELLEDENASIEDIIAARKEVLSLINQEQAKNRQIKKVADDNL
jgi:flagellar motility protein MotE (MotC chaperone)